jgi:hypothetical protein
MSDAPADLGVDLERLAGWMDGHGLGSGAIANAQLLAGGSQNVLLRFTRSGRDYVLRRPPVHLRACLAHWQAPQCRIPT